MSQLKLKLIFAFLLVIAFWGQADAQYYVWTDSVSVTTAAIDSAFNTRWEEVTLKFEGCDGWIKVGSPDTSSWSSRKWWFLPEGETISFGFRTPLKKLGFKANSGTGKFYMAGYKRTAQY